APVAAPRAAHRGLRARPPPVATPRLRAAADGVPHLHPAAHLRADEPDQEHRGRVLDRAHRALLPHARDGRDDLPLLRGLRSGDGRLRRDRARLEPGDGPGRAQGRGPRLHRSRQVITDLDFGEISRTLPYVMSGLQYTVQITIVAAVGGTVVGTRLAVAS